MGRVAERVALVSGAARGMGAQHVRVLAAEGAAVVIGDILDEEGAALAADIGERAMFVHLDVTDEDSWSAAVAAAVERFGSLSVLVNNAGIAQSSPIDQYELAQWRTILDINLTGTFLGIRASVPAMKAAGIGSIINVSSVEGFRGSPGLHGYTATKFAVRGLTKSAALELAEHNIRVNSVHPGYVRTPMTAGIAEDFLVIPLGRGAEPAEVSAMVLFLAGDESSYCTGSEFVVDGGLLSGVPHRTI
jgi:3alpha(or 20beta)-hydroxysteroid dehydrogenase